MSYLLIYIVLSAFLGIQFLSSSLYCYYELSFDDDNV